MCTTILCYAMCRACVKQMFGFMLQRFEFIVYRQYFCYRFFRRSNNCSVPETAPNRRRFSTDDRVLLSVRVVRRTVRRPTRYRRRTIRVQTVIPYIFKKNFLRVFRVLNGLDIRGRPAGEHGGVNYPAKGCRRVLCNLSTAACHAEATKCNYCV